MRGFVLFACVSLISYLQVYFYTLYIDTLQLDSPLSGNLSRLDWRRERSTGGFLLERRIRARHHWHSYVEQTIC